MGSVFSKAYSATKIRNRFSLLAKIGWLIRLKKGLYVVVADIGSLTSNDISVYTMRPLHNTHIVIAVSRSPERSEGG
ncbi:MAG: hypothetical protein J7L53_08545 [Deltaproteobacteria bacterium]|nr:hypothetical protein [Deltaproteobacteria bacterium]